MLLELAIGDAYGAGFEYVSDDVVRTHNRVAYYIQHPWHKLKPGSYTDDTQMSLAITEALLAADPWTHDHLAERFVACYKRDPRPGYSKLFYQLLQQVNTGAELLAQLNPVSDRSGAAMRAAPLGILPTVAAVLDKCRVQATITHNTPLGIQAAQAAALMTHYTVYQIGPKKDLGAFLEQHVPGDWSVPYTTKVEAQGWMSVRAAITAVQRHARLTDLLRDCVAFTGDVDTVAAIALAAASCSSEYTQDLPGTLIYGLENQQFGRDYLLDLDRRWLALKQA